jgi:mannitol/fructose-specific phosphotransferase system IIA component (Ntr-type)
MITSFGPTLRSSLFIADLGVRKRDAALHELTRRAAAHGPVRDSDIAHRALLQRERLGSTAVGRGIAFPNARSITVAEPCLAFARSRRGIDWGAPDGEPVHLVFLLLMPPETAVTHHHEALARVAAAVRSTRARQKLLEASGADEVASLLREAMP